MNCKYLQSLLSCFILSLFGVLCLSSVIAQDTLAKNQINIPDDSPSLKINFYLLSEDKLADSITSQLLPNIAFLNQEFEGYITFELADIILSDHKAYLPDLHTDYFLREGHNIRSIVEPIEEIGAINIYIMDTYLPEGADTALLGFTPILKSKRNTYAINSPRFDRIYIAFAALADPTTIVHEMGHFLGLDHPWDMNRINLELMGLNEKNYPRNHMTYNLGVSEFTPEQLERMRIFAWQFRSYLMVDTP